MRDERVTFTVILLDGGTSGFDTLILPVQPDITASGAAPFLAHY
jgi:hypothetical protein